MLNRLCIITITLILALTAGVSAADLTPSPQPAKITSTEITKESKMAAKAGVIESDRTKLRFIPVSAVTMREGFWKTRMDKNHQYGIPRLLEYLEKNGVVENYMRVSGRKDVERRGPYFTDSDLYKWMEGAAFDLQTYNDPKTKADLDRIIDEVVAAQGEDGYLNTFFQGELFNQRFRNLPHEHELYCAGHLFQAAVAHHRATGEDKLLNAACRYADYMVSVFGPDKKQGWDGHPEVEMALVELYRETGKKEYLDLADFFMSQQDWYNDPKVSGHAVRALYAACGATDYYIETGDPAYQNRVDSMWKDLTTGKTYVTGGVGSRYDHEAIGEAYELPNLRAYTETCAAIASVMFNYRLLSNEGDAKYADIIEKTLYNGVISGVSLDGVAYFYRNPLLDRGFHERQEWWGCTCCPTNMVRTLASIPGYMYSISDDGVWVHLFDNSKVSYKLADGTPFTLEQSTDYPWKGAINLKVGVEQKKMFTVYVRVPGWVRSADLKVNGENIGVTPAHGSYVAIKRTWKNGDIIDLNLAMPVTLIEADPRVREDMGSVAVQRGPIVFCAESKDNPGVSIMDLELANTALSASYNIDLLGGIVTIQATGLVPDTTADRGPLYRPIGEVPPVPLHEVPITLIPYYAWANRGAADMTVWMPFKR